ncbi:MAG: bifunctional 3'-5' exonuclease/DNA polymerase [Clostridia bacterium]|nr:bifunctional 3'-5' exonuclease/DNA polymerase [Clostridia bacterium]
MEKYILAKSAEDVKEYLFNADIISFDFETAPNDAYRDEAMAAVDPHKAHIVGVSFSVDEGTGIYAPIAHKNTEFNIDMLEVLREFAGSEAVKIAHNLAFEAMFLYANNILINPPVYDTMLAAMMTLKTKTEFRNLADSGLKTIVPQLLHTGLPKFTEVTEGRHFDELNPEDYETIRYACADSDYALQLYHVFNTWFDKYLPKHRWIVENIESPTAIFVGLMKYNGVSVDKSLMYQKQFEAGEKILEIHNEIKKFTGKDIDIGANASTDAFKKYLYEDLKLPVLKTTAKYRAAADEESLILLKDWCEKNKPGTLPLLELIHEYRKWNKIKSTYIDGFLDAVNGATGKIHTSFFQLGTDTGRFASRTPNLQNMPRKDNDPVGIRSFLVASEGHIFVDFDFSQIELRVGSWYCRDKKMLETYINDGDIHAQTTSVIYNIPFDEAVDKNAPHYKEQRSIAKNCNFGVFYGLFPNGLMRNLKKAGIDKTKQECGEIIQNLKDGYPMLSSWQEATKNEAMNTGYSETAFGRRRILKGIYSPEMGTRSYWQRCALNTPIQGTAADILKLAMVRILEKIREYPYIKPLLTIHDEILFEVPIDKKDKACNIIKECMEKNPFSGFDVPLKAEGAVGFSFGDMEEII